MEYEENDIFKNSNQTDHTNKIPDFLSSKSDKPNKILICTNSNAAVDEIILQLM